jgi:hypothetical protein
MANYKEDEIHEDLVSTFLENIKDRDRVFVSLKETLIAKFTRLAKDYETIN